MDINDVIIAPLITEKSLADANLGKFTFRVAKWANKNQIKKAVEEKFAVKVVSLSTIIMKGQRARIGKRRIEVSLSFWKKAKIKLAKGEKIGLFELGEK